MFDYEENYKQVKLAIGEDMYNYYLDLYNELGGTSYILEYMPSYINGISSKSILYAIEYETKYREEIEKSKNGEVFFGEMNIKDIIDKVEKYRRNQLTYFFIKIMKNTKLFVSIETECGTSISVLEFIIKDDNIQDAKKILRIYLDTYKRSKD